MGIFDHIPDAQPAAAESNVSPLYDILRSGGTGIRSGIEGIAGLGGDMGKLSRFVAGKGLEWAGYTPEETAPALDFADKASPLTKMPSSQDVRENISEPLIGKGYAPQTTAGKYAKTVGEFLPGSLTGGGGVVRNLITQGVVPAVLSETAGQMAEGSDYEPLARTLAALTGGLTAGAVAGRPVAQTAQQAERAAVVDAMERQGVHLPAAAMPDANVQSFVAGKVGQVPFLGQPLRSSADRTVQQLGDRVNEVVANKGQGNYQASATQTRDHLHNWQETVAPEQMGRAYDQVDNTITGYRRHLHSPLDNTRDLRNRIRREMEVDATDSAEPALRVVERALDTSPGAYPHGLTYHGTKRLRTDVGARGPKGTILPQPGTSMTAMDRLYGALTEDLRMAAYRAGGPRAVRAWETANDFARETKGRQAQIKRLIGAKGENSPENIANRMLNMASAKNAGGNLETLRTARRSVIESANAGRQPGQPNFGIQAWDDVGAALINRISRDPTSVSGTFSPDRFLTAMSKFDDDAAQVLFGQETWRDLQDLRRISETHRALMRKGNPSGTGGVVTLMSMGGSVAGAGTVAATTGSVAPLGALAIAAGTGYATSALLARRASREAFINWARARNGYAEARTPVRLNALMQAADGLSEHIGMETGRDPETISRELMEGKRGKAPAGIFDHIGAE